MLDEKNPRASKCIRCSTCDGFPCLVYAKSDAQVLGVDPALEYPNVALMTNAYVERLETERIRPRSDGRGGAAEWRHRDVTRRTSWSSSCGAINSAALLLRSANDKHPERARQRLGRGRPPLHGPRQFGPDGDLEMPESGHVFQKTLSVNDFYFGSDDWQYPMGHISFVGKLDGDTLERRRAGDRARLHAGPDGEPLAGFLADVRGPARSRTIA